MAVSGADRRDAPKHGDWLARHVSGRDRLAMQAFRFHKGHDTKIQPT